MTPAWLLATATGGGMAAGPVLERVARRAGSGRSPGRDSGGLLHRVDQADPWPTVLFSLLLGSLCGVTADRFGQNWVCAAMITFTAGLLTLAWADVVHLLLPKRVLYPTLAVTSVFLVAASADTGQWHRFGPAAASAAVAFAVFLLLNLLNPRGLAFGDVRLAGVMGGVLGWLSIRCAIEAFVVGSFAGAAVALGALAAHRMNRTGRLPYGVFLALGGVVVLLVSGPAALR